MHVLHVISSIDPRAGGPPAALLGLSSAQVRAGLTVTAVSTHSPDFDDRYAKQMAQRGVGVNLVGPMAGRFHRDLRPAIVDAVRQADVLHVHGLWEEVHHIAAMVARRAAKAFIFRPCGMLDPWSLQQSQWKKRIYLALRLRRDLDGASGIHYTTQTERDLAMPLGLRAQPIVEPNGIELSEFECAPPPGAFRSRYPQIGDRRIVLFLSRIHHKKGPDILINAFAQADLPDTVLVLAGPGEDGYIAQLKAMVAMHGLGHRVIFTGMLHGSDRVAAFADADLFCLLSHQENFGIAVVEALAAGTPVLISDQVNIFREIVEAGVGEAVPVDAEPAATALTALLERDPLPSPDACRQFVRRRYDWQAIAGRWCERYRVLAST